MIKFFVLRLLGVFDLYHQLKIINFIKKNNLNNISVFFDIGAHKGESINLFLKNLNIKKIISFESSPLNFEILKKNKEKLQKKFKDNIIEIINLTLGSDYKDASIKQIDESSSSTLNDINIHSKYFKKKKLLLYNKTDKKFYKEISVKITPLSDFIEKKNIEKIDFIKIDTEGYEYEILKGLGKKFHIVKAIMFEHHYHDMLKKNYKFKDIHEILKQNNFDRIYKAKMPFRKTFEYIYVNKKKI